MEYEKYIENISNSKLTIYDPIEINDEKLWIPTNILEKILGDKLIGVSLKGLPLRTRSKYLKTKICEALGYPVPKSFKKTRPRFLGQMFDTYVQKSNNLQIWNEEIEPTRRYVIFKVSKDDLITHIKVVKGTTLAELDKTGTLTQKYQARIIPDKEKIELITAEDTENLKSIFSFQNNILTFKTNPTEDPKIKELLSISELFNRLKGIINLSFADVGFDQERTRGAFLHKIVCEKLGYLTYQNHGQFPDIKNQLLEIKLQTSTTIDLGLVIPDSQEAIEITSIKGKKIRHCDVRYAIFYGNTDGKIVNISHFYLTTGESFFKRFPKFQGKIVNKKIQIPLPRNFFSI